MISGVRQDHVYVDGACVWGMRMKHAHRHAHGHAHGACEWDSESYSGMAARMEQAHQASVSCVQFERARWGYAFQRCKWASAHRMIFALAIEAIALHTSARVANVLGLRGGYAQSDSRSNEQEPPRALAARAQARSGAAEQSYRTLVAQRQRGGRKVATRAPEMQVATDDRSARAIATALPLGSAAAQASAAFLPWISVYMYMHQKDIACKMPLPPCQR